MPLMVLSEVHLLFTCYFQYNGHSGVI